MSRSNLSKMRKKSTRSTIGAISDAKVEEGLSKLRSKMGSSGAADFIAREGLIKGVKEASQVLAAVESMSDEARFKLGKALVVKATKQKII